MIFISDIKIVWFQSNNDNAHKYMHLSKYIIVNSIAAPANFYIIKYKIHAMILYYDTAFLKVVVWNPDGRDGTTKILIACLFLKIF